MESTVDDKKRLGAYYTPERAACILAEWAVQSPSDQVLEPSFGRCGFLQAVVDQLEEGIHNVHGCDVDSAAFEGPYELLVRENGADGQFQERDFLKVKPRGLGIQGFDVVIGNPPYVSYHDMDEEQREVALRAGVNANLVEKRRRGSSPQCHSRSGIASFSARLSFGRSL